jgi:hypothetical protein
MVVPTCLCADGDAQPLCQRIDQAIAQAGHGPLGALADDNEFCRRVYLDLVGRIPSRDELQEFVGSESSKRRADLIDELLKSDECNRHLAVVFDVMLMERRPDVYVTTDQWRRYLETSFAANKPFNQLAAEILNASGEEDDQRGASRFLLDREVEGHAITRDVSRMFFGRDIQCAQCHDHPLISDYSQAEYYGMLSFLHRSFRFEKTKEDAQKVSMIGEKAEGDVSYSSVFEPGAEKVTALPSLANGIAYDQEPVLAASEAYLVAPVQNVRPVPRYSRRAQLAQLTADGRSELFRTNVANRLWRIMMKRGLVEPPDLIHSDNPPTYPLLLTDLADALAEMNYDIKGFLRQVALSEAYQRSITIPAQLLQDVDEISTHVAQWQQQLEFQQQATDRCQAELMKAAEQLQSSRAAIVMTRGEISKAVEQRTQSIQQRQEAADKRDKAQQRRSESKASVEALRLAAEKAQAASQLRKDDQELAAAAQLLAQRAETALQELAGVDQEIAALEAAVKQADEATAAADKLTIQLSQTHADQVARAKEDAGAYRAIQRHLATEQARLVDLQHQLQLAQQKIELRGAQQALSPIDQRLQIVVAQHKEATSARGALLEQQQKQQQRLDAATQHAQLAQEQLVAADAKLHDHEQLLASLRSAAEQVAAARDQLQGDPELAAACKQLLDRCEQLQQQPAQLQQQHQQANAAAQDAQRQQMAEQQAADHLAAQMQQHDQQLSQLQSTIAAAQAERDKAQAASALAGDRLRDSLTRRFVVGSIQALSPEQLAGSVVCALHLEPRFRSEAEAEWQDKNKDKPATEIDPKRRQQEIDSLAAQRRRQVESSFVSLFASTPGSPQDTFFSTVDQALFLDNDGLLQSWISPHQDNLTAQLVELKSDVEVAENLYRSVLSRDPDEGERTAVTTYLQTGHDNRVAAIQDMIWSLLTSVEFRFNH